MKRLFKSGLLLITAGLVACSSSTDVGSARHSPAVDQAAGQDESATPKPVGLLTDTPEPWPKILQSPQKTIKTKQFSDAADRDLFQLTKELVPASDDIPRVALRDTAEYTAGRTDTFWLVNFAERKIYQSTFRLELVTPHAYWYIEDGLEISLSRIERSAARFEENIYPTVTQVFGSEWSPGIDNDARLNILNARLTGVAGYFSSNDEYPTSVRPRSNQREIIYINALNVPPGGTNYDHVLAHELQHAIHWNADASEDTWVNEGLAELSSSIALDSSFSIRQFLRAAPVSLINWPTSGVESIANYGAASLFMHFLTEHFGGKANLKTFLAQPGDSISGVNEYLHEIGYIERFDDVFKLWAVGNILDQDIQDGDTLLGYSRLDVSSAISGSIRGFEEAQSEIPQYAVEYTELKSISDPSTLSFQGPTSVPLLPVDVGPTGCWWSNSGDSIDATLSHRIDLPPGATAALDYEVWFEIEEDWDYMYLEASVDGGRYWQIIETPATSPENPIGNGFGPGYTGASVGWLQESVDLSPFAGENLRVRFQYVTDDAISASGACVRNLSFSFTGAASNISADDPGWETQGFVFTDNVVRQKFQVQLITTGDKPQVNQVFLDANNAGKLTFQPPRSGEKLIVAVGSMAEKTRQPVSYTLSVTAAE